MNQRHLPIAGEVEDKGEEEEQEQRGGELEAEKAHEK